MTAPHLTITDDVRETVALYTLGALDEKDAAAFEEHLRMGCSVCDAEVRASAEVAARLALDTPIVLPPPGLRDRLLQRIAAEEPQGPVVRADSGLWRETPFPGISIKRLSQDKKTNTSTCLVRLEAGAAFGEHLHMEPEHVFLLEGDLQFEDHSLGAGDYELRLPGTQHSSSFTRNGCLMLLTTGTHVEAVFLGL